LKKRTHNFEKLNKFFSKYEKWFVLPQLLEKAETNWLAFPLTVKKNAPFKRYDFLEHLESKGIQTRVLFSGNIVRHPIYKDIKFKVSGSLKNADTIMASSLLLGCHQALADEDIRYIQEVSEEFFKKYA
jgi:CDP-6-deoxy-D-xylo-4-hexulose-3-dehydrase